MGIVDLVLCLAALAGAVPVLVFFTQIVASTPRLRPEPVAASTRRPSVAVLIPAHDECENVAGTVAALLPELAEGDRLLVVADNCRDDTAAIAEAAGAEVLERYDAERRGKGFALDAGVTFLEQTGQRDVVVVIDADCTMAAGAIDMIARLSAAKRCPVQAAYVLSVPPCASATHRVAAFAARVKSVGRPLGWSRIGFPCHLSGTGFAVPAQLLRSVQLASANLAEDLKLGMDLALIGAPPRFCPHAEVRSFFPESDEARRSQQTRWEHGHLGLISAYAPRLVGQSIRRRDLHLWAMALDLCVPPLVALTLLEIGIVLLALSWVLLPGGLLPLLLAGSSFGLLGLSLALAWFRWGRGLLPGRDVVVLPRFVLGKIPILLRYFFDRQLEWVRTERTTVHAPDTRPSPTGAPGE